jgi:hypothetical protein
MNSTRWASLLVASSLLACTHTLEIDNPAPVTYSAPVTTHPLVIGVADAQTGSDSFGYVDAVAKSLQLQGVVQRVVHPYEAGTPVDVVAEVTVNPVYDGSGWNFLINFPGFLIWAPAWHGYHYSANPKTQVVLKTPDGKTIDTVSFEHPYEFRQADIGRTWTEISWFEWGVIALFGGAVFTRYDTDQTEPFIRAVADNYGEQVATRIATRLAQGATAAEKPGG